MPIFPKGAGFALKSYVGQEEAFFNTWELTRKNVGTTRGSGLVRDIRLPTWPLSKQKAALFSKFDPQGQLFRSGAHAPLMVWLGSKSRRSQDALWSREAGMTRRCWGPNSENRSRLMQAQGSGPPPWQRMQANVKGGTGDDAHGGDGKGGKVGNGEGIRGGGDHKGQKGGKGGWHRGGEDNTGGKGEGIRGGGDNQGQKGGQGGWHAKDNTGGKGEGIRGGGDGNGK
jgi:hypothetical protein